MATMRNACVMYPRFTAYLFTDALFADNDKEAYDDDDPKVLVTGLF